MLNRKSMFGVGASALALSLMLSAPASAQDASTPDGDAAETQSGFGEIIVTARKRDERLQDVPLAITAFTAQDLERYATGSMTQLSTQTPALVAGTTGNNTGGGDIVLRGVGSPATGPVVDQAVSVNVDGVQISKAFALRLGVFDLERVEVLKGPQALFFGKNSPGGIISLVSADPGYELEARVRTGYEFAAQQKFVEAMISAPLSDTVGVRVVGYFADQRGWFINDAEALGPQAIPAFLGGGSTSPTVGASDSHGPGVKDYFVRGTIAFTPSDQFDATLKLSYVEYDQQGGIGFGNHLFDCPSGGPFYATILGWEGSKDCSLDRRQNVSNLGPGLTSVIENANAGAPVNGGRPFQNTEQILGSFTANYHPTDSITLTSVTGYWRMEDAFLGNFSWASQAYLAANYETVDEQFTQEVRLSTDFDAPVNVVLGAFYQEETVDFTGATGIDSLYTSLFTGFAVPPSPLVLIASQFQHETEAWSVFGQAIVDVTSQIQFTAGVRYSHEEKNVTASTLGAMSVPIAFTPDSRSFQNTSPEFSLTYKPIENLTLYGSYRYGFKSGGFDVSSSVGLTGPMAGDVTYDQEEVDGGEIGMKGTFFDRQVLIDLSAYHFEYSGLQVAAFEPATVSYKVTNAGTAISEGIDLSVQVRPDAVPGLSLRTAIAYSDAHYDRFDSSPCYAGQSQAQGCNLITSAGPNGGLVITPATPMTVGNAQDLSGRTLHRAPEISANVGATYEHEFGNGMTLSLSGDGNYTGSYQAMAEQDPRAEVDGYWKLNASIALRSPGDRWELALIGTNLTNELQPINALSYAATGSGTGTPMSSPADLQANITDPRAVTLQLTFKH